MTPQAKDSPAVMLRRFWSQHKVALKKVTLALSPILLLLLIFGHAVLVSAGLKISNKVVLYARVAPLYAMDPDRRILMPVQGVVKKQIANTWHAPRGDSRRHEGQDIFAPRGTPVVSATDGYVVNIGENNLGGQTVSVLGAGGRTYYYAHLDSYARNISEGDYVTRQTVLGYVGTTGNAGGTPPHLHFGVYAASGAMNPLPLLSDRPDRTGNDRVAGTEQRQKPRPKQVRNRAIAARS